MVDTVVHIESGPLPLKTSPWPWSTLAPQFMFRSLFLDMVGWVILQQLACIFRSKYSLYIKAGFTITSHTSIQFTSITFFLTLSNPPPLLSFLPPHLQERRPHFSYDTPCPWEFSSWGWLISFCVMIRTCRKETRRITPLKHAWRDDQGTYDFYSGD